MKNQEFNISGLEVLRDEPLKNHTTFKIGGPAKFFVRINNKQDLFCALNEAKKFDLPIFILGGGSNVVISDDGFAGLVIKMENGEFEVKGVNVKVFAGNNLGNTIREAAKKGLSGLEFAGNIPGTIGGGIRGNAGAYGKGVGDLVKEVEVIKMGDKEHSLQILSKEQCQFGYRESVFKKNVNWFITEATFSLLPDPLAQEKLAEIDKEWGDRCAKQPLNLPSAGCNFKNVEYKEEYAKYKDWATKGKIPAAKLIEEADLKGKKIGGAMVSDKHANFIVNTGNATASDVIQLISLVKARVRDKFGIQLEEEVQYVGF